MEIDGKLLAAIAIVPTAISMAAAVHFFYEARYAHQVDHEADIVDLKLEIIDRDNANESKRHGEITQFYRRRAEEGTLTEAEKWRADLAEREQKRLHDKVLGVD